MFPGVLGVRHRHQPWLPGLIRMCCSRLAGGCKQLLEVVWRGCDPLVWFISCVRGNRTRNRCFRAFGPKVGRYTLFYFVQLALLNMYHEERECAQFTAIALWIVWLCCFLIFRLPFWVFDCCWLPHYFTLSQVCLRLLPTSKILSQHSSTFIMLSFVITYSVNHVSSNSEYLLTPYNPQ